MNTPFDSHDTRFDRLVDGELSPEEYRALLTSLDDEPEGWRRCALAFLESQALSRDLPPALQPQPPVAPYKPEAPARESGRPLQWLRLRQALYAGALAASVALAFVMGGWMRGNRAPDENMTAKSSPDRQPTAATERMLTTDRYPPGVGSAGSRKPAPIGNVHLVVDGNSLSDDEIAGGINVPVYDLEQVGNDWLMREPALPSHLIEQLQELGHKVEHRQQLVPVQLDDGRQLLVPIDGYQIRPPQRGTY